MAVLYVTLLEAHTYACDTQSKIMHSVYASALIERPPHEVGLF